MSRRGVLTMAVAALVAACKPGAATGTRTASSPSVDPQPSVSTSESSVGIASTAAIPTSTAPPGPAVEVVRGPSGRNEVALTFHGAGDPALARSLLKILADHQTVVTVFVVGSWLDANPQMAQEIVQAGHEIANHTWSHPVLSDLGPAAIQGEISRCKDVIASLTGVSTGYFRQSSAEHPTDVILQIAGSQGYPVCVSYSLDSMDWTDPGASAVRRYVAAATAGEIISLHLGHSSTIGALALILDDLASAGLRPVTVKTLLRA
jgi:peptidoglycan/xylan/chitin deacetylase (PgdA/CDA1 family)